MVKLTKIFLAIIFIAQVNNVLAWQDMPMPRLHVDGKHLKDPHGNIVKLHGYAQTFSPWFNEQGQYWNNYDVEGCLTYNKDIIDQVLEAGWEMNFVRMHMDPYWSSTPGCEGRYEGEECFDENRFVKYLDEVFVPMAEYAVSKGLYVVLRPPGVCPEEIEVGGVYYHYLLQVWGIVAEHPKLKNHANIMFELANEPINILGSDGTYGSTGQAHFDQLNIYFQDIVDSIRTSADNILWVPGLSYQSQYAGFATNPIEGEDIGYAVHVYPGWFNSGEGYGPFQQGWDRQVQPVADFAPIIVTEMDWAPEKYESSWGKGITGTSGGEGFGANFKKITDDAGNVSWLLFTEPHLLADFTGKPPAEGEEYIFLNDPEACPWPIYHWYQEYAQSDYPRPDFAYRSTADNGDGTFTNPLIHGDFPSPILVREEDKYFLLSVNSEASPDTTVLESKDLINWEYSQQKADDLSLEDVVFLDDTDKSAGTAIQTNAGEWWAVVSYDEGAFGRFPNILPVNWTDGSPVADESAKDGTLDKPDVGRDYSLKYLRTNDNFRHYQVGAQWNLTNDADSVQWSLLERAGFMRLKNTSTAADISSAQTILSQRVLAYSDDLSRSFGTVRLEFDHMQDGDVAGLSVFGEIHNFIGIKMADGERKLITSIDEMAQEGPAIEGSEIYLRALASYTSGKVSFYYSVDNNTYHQLGDELEMETASSSRFGLFNYATMEVGGYVDFDWFSTESTFTEEKFYSSDFDEYTEASLTLTDLVIEGGNDLAFLTSSTKRLKVNAVFADGHTEEVGFDAAYTNLSPEIISISRGNIITKKDGEATLTIAYTGPLGHLRELTLNVISTTFPLTNGLFDADIWEDGTFDESTKTLQTGQWGFGGWLYEGIDLSEYKYIVVRLGSENTANADFRLFDESSYWSSPATYDFDEKGEVVVHLKHATKDDGSAFNPSHVYIAGFWSNGSNPFVIDTVFVTSSSEYDPPTIMAKSASGNEPENMSDFSYEEGFGPSAAQSFKVSGYLLTDDIVIEAPAEFEVSLDEEGEYASSLVLTPDGGDLAETSVYVRLSQELSEGAYAGQITLSSEGAYNVIIDLAGSVVPATVTGLEDLPASNASVISVHYYTLTGRIINAPRNHQGLYVERKLLSDGTAVTRKVFRK